MKKKVQQISASKYTIKKDIKEIKAFSDFKSGDYFVFLALAFAVGIIPLIVKYASVPVGSNENLLIKLDSYTEDMFSYYKSCLLIASAALLSFYYLYRFFTSDFDLTVKPYLKKPLVTASLAYVAAILLSSLFSPFKYTVLHGVSERYESVFVLLSYLIIFYGVQDFVKSRFQARLVVSILLASAFVIGLIGLSQFIDRDVFQTTFGQEHAGFPQGILSRFTLGNDLYRYMQTQNSASLNLVPGFEDIYATLYNPNFAGLYAVLTAPLFLITGMFEPVRSYQKYILLTMGVFMCFILVGAKSSSGLAGLVAAGFLSIILCSVYFIRNKGKVGSFMGVAAAAALCLVAAVALIPGLRGNMRIMINKFSAYANPSNHYFLKDVSIQNNTLKVDTESGSLTVSFAGSIRELTVTDADGSILDPARIETDENDPSARAHFYDSPVFGSIFILTQTVSDEQDAAEEMDVAVVILAGERLMLCLPPGKELMALSHMFEPLDIHQSVPSIGFEGYELFGSNRGYIWSRSFPLIRDNLILGTGPDTFILSFPQTDLIGKLRFMGHPYLIVDKPHNYYLQVCINTGLLSLLAVLFIFGWYVIRTIIALCRPSPQDFGLRLGILTGICGYLVASLATDSTVHVSPVFWAVLGLGVGMEALASPFHEEKIDHVS